MFHMSHVVVTFPVNLVCYLHSDKQYDWDINVWVRMVRV